MLEHFHLFFPLIFSLCIVLPTEHHCIRARKLKGEFFLVDKRCVFFFIDKRPLLFPLLCTCICSLFIHRVSIYSAYCLESTHTDVYWTFPTQDGCCCGLPPTHWMVHLRAVSDLVLCCRCPTPPPSCKGWCIGMDAIQEATSKGIHGDRGERVMTNYIGISVEHWL